MVSYLIRLVTFDRPTQQGVNGRKKLCDYWFTENYVILYFTHPPKVQ